MDSLKPGPLSRCTSMAEAIIVSVNADALSNSGCIQCSIGATQISNLFSLLSPFPLVEFLSLLEYKNLLPIVRHADDCPPVLRRLVIERLRECPDLFHNRIFTLHKRLKASSRTDGVSSPPCRSGQDGKPPRQSGRR